MLPEVKEDYLQLDDLGGPHACASAISSVRENHEECLRALETSALLRKDNNGETAMHHAARDKNHNMIRVLLKLQPALRDIPSLNGDSPVLISASLGDNKGVQILLGGSLRQVISSALHRDQNGTSVLMATVVRGDNEMAAWLLNSFGKALAILDNHSQMLPVHVAAAQGNVDFIRMAVKFDSQMVNHRDEFGCTPAAYSVQAGCLTSTKYLIDSAKSEIAAVSNRGQSLLHIASLCGHLNIVSWIVDKMGTDPILWCTKDGANAVHCAAFCGSVPILSFLLSSFSRKKGRSLLGGRDGRGNTALHLAAINNHLEAATYLLEQGSDDSLVNLAGHSAKGIARLRGHGEMADMLEGWSGKNKKKSSKSSKKKSSPSPPPTPSSVVLSASPQGRSSLSPRDLSSGYSSAAEVYPESTTGSTGPVERHLMHFIEDDSDGLKDCAAQTDHDLLNDHIQVLDDAEWAGLGLSAVADLDRFLEAEL